MERIIKIGASLATNAGRVKLVSYADEGWLDIGLEANSTPVSIKTLDNTAALALRDALIEMYPLPAQEPKPRYEVEDCGTGSLGGVGGRFSICKVSIGEIRASVGRVYTIEHARQIVDALNAGTA